MKCLFVWVNTWLLLDFLSLSLGTYGIVQNRDVMVI